MAVLHNDAKTLRLFLEVVDREVLPVVPGQPPAPKDSARMLGTAGVEFYDRRDKQFWPFIRLPVIYLGGPDAHELLHSLKDLTSQVKPGFVFRTGMQNELAIAIGSQPDKSYTVEAGIDLALYLQETAGVQSETGRELALFRFTTSTAEVVRFADQLKQEVEKLR